MCKVGLSSRNTIGSDLPGTKISSIRFASAINGISGSRDDASFEEQVLPCKLRQKFIAACAALNCPFPPSISIKSGSVLNFSSSARARRKRRVMTSCIIAKSFCPLTERILNRRYSPDAGFPSSKTTIDPTANLSPRLEISYASMRRSGCFNPSNSCSSTSAGSTPLL